MASSHDRLRSILTARKRNVARSESRRPRQPSARTRRLGRYHDGVSLTQFSINRQKCRSGRSFGRFDLETLERRILLTTPGNIVPEQLYQDVAFTDSRGDTVEVSINGPTPANTGLHADAGRRRGRRRRHQYHQSAGVTSGNNLIIQVTPNELTITSGGQYYSQMFSAGYINITNITAMSDPTFPLASAVSDLGGMQLSAAVVNSITLPGVNVGTIALDTGDVPYVDRVNAATLASISVSSPVITATGGSTLQEIVDESPVGLLASYTPCTGLIGLGDIQAQSISSIVIDGATPLSPINDLDAYNTMNDFKGVITVSGAIGSLVGPNSALKGTVIAGSIGSVDIGIISGTITTTDPSQPFTITLPAEFSGFINSAGHLNLAFPQTAAGQGAEPGTTPAPSLVTGQITSGGGITGVDPTSMTDTIYVPDQYAGVVSNTSTTSGIADIAIDGVGMSQWTSASSIGDITANSYAPGFIATAGTDIGKIQSFTSDIAGHFQSGGNIGNVSSSANIAADLIAGGNIGSITGVTGGLTGQHHHRRRQYRRYLGDSAHSRPDPDHCGRKYWRHRPELRPVGCPGHGPKYRQYHRRQR